MRYDILGVVSLAGSPPDMPVLGESTDDLPEILVTAQPDEVILAEAEFDERTVLAIVERAHRQGVRVRLAPNTTELLVREGEYVPGSGVPLFELRPPVLVGWDWAIKRAFDLVVSVLVLVVGLPLWLLIALAIKLDSRGPVLLRRPSGRRRRARVRDAQVPHDGRRTPPSSRRGSRTRTRPRGRSSRFGTTRA